MDHGRSKGNPAPHEGGILLAPRPLPACAAVEAAFDPFDQGGWRIVDPIQRIWAGERDEAALAAGIDPNSALIVREILKKLRARGFHAANQMEVYDVRL